MDSKLLAQYQQTVLNKEWRMQNLYKIQDKNRQLILFNPNRAQLHFNQHRTNRNIILKSRQLGFTTLESIDGLDDTLFSMNHRALFIAHSKEEAIKIFDKKIMLAWDNMEPKFRDHNWKVNKERANELEFYFLTTKAHEKHSSSISVSLSGRSGTFNRVHITEFASIARNFPKRAEEIVTGTIPSVPISGRVDVESTAFGDYGLFYDIFWEAWIRGEPKTPYELKAHFYNWTWDPEVFTTSPDPNLPAQFREYQQEKNLTDQQITFYYYKFKSLGSSWRRLKQEYPTTPEEAFVGSGNKLFEDIQGQEPKTPIEEKGNWKYYAEYQSGHRYCSGADVSEGVGGDSSAITILDLTAGEVVATYHSNTIAPDVFAYEIRDGGNRFGTCLVAVERNNHGHATLVKLKEIYPVEMIFSEIKQDRKENVQTERLGWHTNSATKPQMFYDLKQGLNEKALALNDATLIRECQTYDKDDLNETRPDPDRTIHWDLLTACCIAWQMRGKAEGKKMYQTTVRGGVKPYFPEIDGTIANRGSVLDQAYNTNIEL